LHRPAYLPRLFPGQHRRFSRPFIFHCTGCSSL
jgi:hypothetical protein